MNYGRWTIQARAKSQARRPSEYTVRARMHVRCVCGLEKIVWQEDLEAGRSTGCESRRCAARFHASLDIREMLTGWVDREVELLRPYLAVDVLSALQADRLGRIEEAIREYLRAPSRVVLDLGPPPPVTAFRKRA